jgi:hypothetical protein
MESPIPNIIAVVAVLENPTGDQRSNGPESQQDPARPGSNPRHGENRVGKAPIQAVEKNRPGQDKSPDEQEHQRIGKRREHLLCRCHPEHNTGSRTQQGRHRQRQRFCYP